MLCGGEVIDVPALPEVVRSGDGMVSRERERSPSWPIPDDVPLREAVALLEKYMLLRALQRASGNRSEAARQLGIGRPHLYAKLEEHGLNLRSDGDEG